VIQKWVYKTSCCGKEVSRAETDTFKHRPPQFEMLHKCDCELASDGLLSRAWRHLESEEDDDL
jgi:hypothetical protein